jgi:hypothetical protein
MKRRPHVSLARKTFPSGPGFEVRAGGVKIGGVGKHYREVVWWWQLDSKLDPIALRDRQRRRAGKPLGRGRRAAGMAPNKTKALGELMGAWKATMARAVGKLAKELHANFGYGDERWLAVVRTAMEELEP